MTYIKQRSFIYNVNNFKAHINLFDYNHNVKEKKSAQERYII